MEKEKLFQKLRENKKLRSDIFMVLALGVLLLLCSSQFFSKKQEKPIVTETAQAAEKREAAPEEERDLEKRLEAIFSKVEGAGEVKVMVVYNSGSELTVAENVKRTNENTTETVTQGDKRVIVSQNEQADVVLLEKADGSTAPLVLKEGKPKVEGIVIVAQGGGDIVVKDALSRAAQALLNVPAHKVEILKMKQGGK